MRNTVRRSLVLVLVVVLFFAGMGILLAEFILQGSDWVTNKADRHIYNNGAIINAGKILDRNKTVLAYSEDGKRHFNESASVRKATLHTVGDTTGFISTGIHTSYSAKLSGYNMVNGVYNLKKYGQGNDILLTIDSDVCATAYNALNGRKGCISVYNYKTGEVVCLVSAPTFDPENKPSDIDTDESGKYEGIYLNRFFSGLYTPGSTFKIITSAAAIENIPDIYSRKFTCTGSYRMGTGNVICNGTHGTINFEQALGYSCNSTFAQIGEILGNDILTATAEKLGFNQDMSIGEINVNTSLFTLPETNPLDLGWASIGQYETLVTPTHMMTLMGAIANGGTAKMPYVIDKMTSPSGTTVQKTIATNCREINLEVSTAQKLKSMLRSNVNQYYGDYRFPGLSICGKTGTAEVASGKPHAWFVGFSDDQSFPYAFVVILENSGSGSGNAIPVANTVLQKIKEKG